MCIAHPISPYVKVAGGPKYSTLISPSSYKMLARQVALPLGNVLAASSSRRAATHTFRAAIVSLAFDATRRGNFNRDVFA